MTDLPKSAQKVAHALQESGLDASIIEMRTPTRTADEAAAACGCTPGQIVKSLVFRGNATGSPVLLLVSGANRVDLETVAEPLGEALTRPDASYVRDVTGYAIGGIPPLGHATPLRTFFDVDLLAYPVVWAAAGTPTCVFAAQPDRLAEAASAEPIRMNNGPGTP